jgi:hypothetical protein
MTVMYVVPKCRIDVGRQVLSVVTLKYMVVMGLSSVKTNLFEDWQCVCVAKTSGPWVVDPTLGDHSY